MFSIDKQRIKFLFFGFASLLLFFAIVPSITQAQTEISPIQLRTIQTRKFIAPPDKVIEAIQALHADRYDAQCAGGGLSAKQIVSMGKKYQFQCGVSKVSQNDRLLKISNYQRMYEIYTNDQGTETVLRYRLYLSANTVRAQSINAERYQKHFQEIADTLFVEAIELTPAEIQ